MRKQIYWKGEFRCLTDIARLEGISKWMLYDRIKNQGMTIEQAVSTPHRYKHAEIAEHKPWREMRPGEIAQIKALKCRRCVYAAGTKLNGDSFTGLTCDYIGHTGHMRGCDPRDCEFWKEEGE